jgi:Protein of unknown function (DUF2892)
MKKFLATNEGTVDRVVRVVLGVALLTLTIVGPKTLWGLLGLLPLATGLVGTCAVYSIFGLSTCRVKDRTTVTQS